VRIGWIAAVFVGSFVLASVVPGVVPMAGAHHYPRGIQPGAQMTAPAGCTVNFVFADNTGKLYIGSAGHCANLGQSVSIAGIGAIGSVVWDSTGADFALVQISSNLYDQVDPAVRHWGGPTGFATSAGGFLIPPRVLYHYGYGTGFSASEATRPRAGELDYIDGQVYLAETTATFGDSGSPFIDSNGLAVGVVSEYAFDQAHTDRGPTVEWILNRAVAEKGLQLTLLTAPLVDPVERTVLQVEHTTGVNL
jgi:hypothetical protein